MTWVIVNVRCDLNTSSPLVPAFDQAKSDREIVAIAQTAATEEDKQDDECDCPARKCCRLCGCLTSVDAKWGAEFAPSYGILWSDSHSVCCHVIKVFHDMEHAVCDY